MTSWYKQAQENGTYKKKLDIHISDDLMHVFDRLESAGYPALIVGGAVRDALMSEVTGVKYDSKDIDIEVYGTDYSTLNGILRTVGDEIEQREDVKRVHISLEGDAFQVLKLFIKYKNGVIDDYDFSLPRRDSKREGGGGHKAFDVEADPNMSPKEASSRRDFTINALAYDPLQNEIHDYFGGVEDIYNGILRATSKAFAEDPLRVLRGMQFSSRLSGPNVCKKCNCKFNNKMGIIEKGEHH